MFVPELSKGPVSLTQLKLEHLEYLQSIAADPTIWTHAPWPFFDPHIFENKWFHKALKQMESQERMAYIIYYQQKPVGSTSFYDICPEHKKLKIGYTWFTPSIWGTYANPLAKFLMLEYVFEQLQYNRVGFLIDADNLRSAKALEKIGATQEGILRNDMVLPNQRIRHSLSLSIILEEWQLVKDKLMKLIK